MGDVPTMQALAVYAQEHLENAGGKALQAFDSTVELYADGGYEVSPEQLEARACEVVTRAIDNTGETPRELRDGTIRFVSQALRFLSCQYPDPLRAREEHWLLSRLFQLYLEEARLRTVVSERVSVGVAVPAVEVREAGHLIKQIDHELVCGVHHVAKAQEHLSTLGELHIPWATLVVERLDEVQTVLGVLSREMEQTSVRDPV